MTRSVSSLHRSLLRITPAACGLLGVLGAGTAQASDCYDFEALPAGTSFVVGNVINAVDATIDLVGYRPFGGGPPVLGGSATVVSSTLAGGSATQELELNNIVTRVTPNTGAIEVTLLYADYGGEVNFGINGDVRRIADLADLDGLVVGNAGVFVTEVPIVVGGLVVGVQGELTAIPLVGSTIDAVGIGGQEFYIDDMCHID